MTTLQPHAHSASDCRTALRERRKCPGATIRRHQVRSRLTKLAAAKAQADCAALWADHALDPLRDKVALGQADVRHAY